MYRLTYYFVGRQCASLLPMPDKSCVDASGCPISFGFFWKVQIPQSDSQSRVPNRSLSSINKHSG
jgi:hypothetical protein